MRTGAGALYSLALLGALTQEMKARGLTQIELAARAGISTSFLSQLLAGTGNPSLQVLSALAVALDVPLTRLVDLTDIGEAGREHLPGRGGLEVAPTGYRRVNCVLPEPQARIVDEWAKIAERQALARLGPKTARQPRRK